MDGTELGLACTSRISTRIFVVRAPKPQPLCWFALVFTCRYYHQKLFTEPAVLAKQLELRWASASVASSSASEAPADLAVSSSDQDAATAAEEISKTASSERGLPTGVSQRSGDFVSRIWGEALEAIEDARKKKFTSERGFPTGVYPQSSGNFVSQIWFGSKLNYIGTYETSEQASAAFLFMKSYLAGPEASALGTAAAFDEAKKQAVEAVEKPRKKARPRKATSESGLPAGVRTAPSGNYACQINWGGKTCTIGTFGTIEQASAAYVLVSSERDNAGAKPSAVAFVKAKKKALEAVEEVRKKKPKAMPTGVHPVSSGNFESQISRGGRTRYIGTFDTPEQAYAAHMSVKKDLDAANLSSCSADEVDAVFNDAKKKAVKAVGRMLARKPVPRKGYKQHEKIEGPSQTHDKKASGNTCTAIGRPYLRRNLLYCRDPMDKSHFIPWEKESRSARAAPELPALDMLANLFDHSEPERYNKALGKAMRTPLRKRKHRITPTTTPENTRIRIGENCRKVKTGDLVPNTRVLVAYKEKDLFRATVRELPDKEGGKYRVHYDSYKKDKTYLVPFSDFRALLDEDNCPLEITAPDPDSTSPSSSSSTPQRTKLFFDVQMAQRPSQVLSPSTAEMQYGKAFPPYEPQDKSSGGKDKWNQPKDHRTAFELFAESNQEQARLHLKRTDRKNKVCAYVRYISLNGIFYNNAR